MDRQEDCHGDRERQGGGDGAGPSWCFRPQPQPPNPEATTYARHEKHRDREPEHLGNVAGHGW